MKIGMYKIHTNFHIVHIVFFLAQDYKIYTMYVWKEMFPGVMLSSFASFFYP